MSYDPLFDAAQKAVDDVLGDGEYLRLNQNNPGVPRDLKRRVCSCGSGLPSRELLDARGIYCCRVCDQCEKAKMAEFRPDIFADPHYWTDEPVEED